MLDTFRKTFYLVGRDNPVRWIALVAGAVVASGLEMLGALLIYLLLALVADPGGELEVPLVGDLRAYIGDVEQATFLLWAALAMGVFFVLRAGFQIVYAYVKNRLAFNAGSRLSTKLAYGYLRMPYSFHLQRNSAELVRNAHQTVEQLAQHCFLPVIIVIAESLLVLGLLAVMVLVAPAATGLAVAIVGSSALLLLFLVQPRLRVLGQEAQLRRTRTLSALQQSLEGIRDIKVLGVEEHFGERYERDHTRLARTLYLRGSAIELPRLVIETSLIIFILLLFAGSVVMGNATTEVLSTLGLFAYAGLRIQPSLQKLVAGLNSVRYSQAAVDDVHTDLLLLEDFDAETLRGGDSITFEHELRLEDVSFHYDEGERRPALGGVNLTIAKGEFIGICGPTGGGKSTLTDIIIGLLEPTEGRVTVDGRDLAGCRPGWFSKLGVVPQSVFLVDDTLRRNIALGADDADIDDTAVEEAVHLAQLEEVIASLPQGLNTVVGERGVRFSGGQRQRIAIARALYRRPEVLVFDEGTSALDNTTEANLIAALENLRGERTIVLVAHRISTVRHADRIVYVTNGNVDGIGTFEGLWEENLGFRSLAQVS